MKIAILGTRGVPASYSGFETAAEQLASRFSARGHEVVVYCRPHVVNPRLGQHRGAQLVHLRTVQNKYLETFVHTVRSALHAASRTRPDIVLYFGAGNAPVCLITRWAGIPAVINIDGLDSERRKWPAPAKLYLRFAERLAPRWAEGAITDSHAVAEVYERKYRRRIGVVAYGAEDPGPERTGTLERLGLEPRRYVLFVGRLEPDNNPHLLIDALARLPAARTRGIKLAIVGGAPYANRYIHRLRGAACQGVVFAGFVFGAGYWELQRNAYAFCAPTDAGGTHPVILDAMAVGNCVLLSDHPPNVETAGAAGVYFSSRRGASDLALQLGRLLDDPELVAEHRARALLRARRYSWDAVADQYEQLLSAVVAAGGPGYLPSELADRESPAVAERTSAAL